MGGDEEKLRRGYGEDVSKWDKVVVMNDRVTELLWYGKRLSGSVPEEIGALSALTFLALYSNDLTGPLPLSLGNLTSLAMLYLHDNYFSGPLPPSLSNLSNLHTLLLRYENGVESNDFATGVPPAPLYQKKDEVQAYLATLKS